MEIVAILMYGDRNTHIAIITTVMICILVGKYQCFGGTCCFQLQGRNYFYHDGGNRFKCPMIKSRLFEWVRLYTQRWKQIRRQKVCAQRDSRRLTISQQ